MGGPAGHNNDLTSEFVLVKMEHPVLIIQKNVIYYILCLSLLVNQTTK